MLYYILSYHTMVSYANSCFPKYKTKSYHGILDRILLHYIVLNYIALHWTVLHYALLKHKNIVYYYMLYVI